MKRALFFAAIVISILVINNLAHSIYGLWSKQELLVNTQKDLESKKKENKELKDQLSVAQSEQFVEKEARDKLFLVKVGESGVILDKKLLEASESADSQSQPQSPNWKKWWELFFTSAP
ncbi:MAG: septum formation initiator family protein [Candidatus Levyibacteriota bacterium]